MLNKAYLGFVLFCIWAAVYGIPRYVPKCAYVAPERLGDLTVYASVIGFILITQIAISLGSNHEYILGIPRRIYAGVMIACLVFLACAFITTQLPTIFHYTEPACVNPAIIR